MSEAFTSGSTHSPESEDEDLTSAPKGPARRLAATTVLLCVTVAAIAASLVAFVLYRPVPSSLAVASAPTEVQLISETMADSRAVDLDVKLGEDASLPSPVTGIVTRTTCVSGASLSSGTVSVVVDRTPLVNLHTSTPLWRDLAFGTEGEDVSALQHELARLGYDVPETGRFDWQTWSAWDALVESLDGDTSYGALSLAQVLWLPSPTTPVSACPVPLGQSATQGSPLVSLATPLLAAAIKNYPTDLVTGARKLTVGKTDIGVDDHGKLTTEGLTALAGTEEFSRYAQSPKDATLQAELVLTEPVQVYPVPPAAVAMTGTNTGCVNPSTGKPVPVSVVSSKLGRSYITFAKQPSFDTIAATTDKGLTCS